MFLYSANWMLGSGAVLVEFFLVQGSSLCLVESFLGTIWVTSPSTLIFSINSVHE